MKTCPPALLSNLATEGPTVDQVSSSRTLDAISGKTQRNTTSERETTSWFVSTRLTSPGNFEQSSKERASFLFETVMGDSMAGGRVQNPSTMAEAMVPVPINPRRGSGVSIADGGMSAVIPKRPSTGDTLKIDLSKSMVKQSNNVVKWMIPAMNELSPCFVPKLTELFCDTRLQRHHDFSERCILNQSR